MTETVFQNILVRQVNWIGDVVMSLPAMSALREICPGARLTVLARPWVAELLFNHPAVDRVMLYEHQGRHRGMAGKMRLARELRKESFDLAMLFQNAFDAALIASVAGIPERVGYDRDGRGVLLTRRVPLRKDHKQRHHVDYYLDLLEGWAGFDPRASGRLHPRLYISEEENARARKILDAVSAPQKGVVGINPGAAYGSSKRWHADRFARVADRLHERTGMGVVIFGGPSETGIALEIAGLMKSAPLVLAGRTTVRELISLISLCRIFITNDSGPMHIAAAVGTPLVALFGSTSPEATGPYTDRARVVRARGLDCTPCFKRECPGRDLACMTSIGVDEVVAAAEEMLQVAADETV